MAKYRLKPLTVDIEEYKEGLEDGFAQYYWYENGPDPDDEYDVIRARSIEELKPWRDKLIAQQVENHPFGPLVLENPEPFIETKDGVELIRTYNKYIVTNQDGEKKTITKEELDKFYDKI